jgi:Fe-S-cluster containining protein
MNPIDLPPVPSPLRDAYRALIEDVDRSTARLAGRLHEHLRCMPGCSSCCRRFSVAPIEAALIGEQLGQRSVTALADDSTDRCGLLIDDLCSVYTLRPLICRTQGLPIAYIDEVNERIEVSVCPLNFSQSYRFSHDDLLYLDPFNRLLAGLNIRYCRETGVDASSRISLGQRFRFS